MKLSAHLLAKLAVTGAVVTAAGACGPQYATHAPAYPVVIEPVVIEPAYVEPVVTEPQYAKPPPGDVRATPPPPVVLPDPDPEPIDIDDCPGCGMG
jgi:hypothetical protein